jgi:hypothetical protein
MIQSLLIEHDPNALIFIHDSMKHYRSRKDTIERVARNYRPISPFHKRVYRVAHYIDNTLLEVVELLDFVVITTLI